MFIFINKADIDLTLPDARSEYLIKLKKRIGEDDVDVREIEFFFTTSHLAERAIHGSEFGSNAPILSVQVHLHPSQS